jgi:hypothetical protein
VEILISPPVVVSIAPIGLSLQYTKFVAGDLLILMDLY